MNWANFLEFLLEGKKKPTVAFTGDFLPKTKNPSKPFSKRRMAEIQELEKHNGRSAILKSIKKDNKK